MSYHLSRRFNPFQLLLISINGMVGSAWLFAPLYAARIAGNGAVIAWIIGGVATILIGLSFAELSVMFPAAGGSTTIPKVSHGQFASFMMGWLAWISALTMAPIEVQAVLQYASNFFPSLMVHAHTPPVLSHYGLLWALLLMLAMSILNGYSHKGLLSVNLIIFIYKILVILLIVIMLPTQRFITANFHNLLSNLTTAHSWHTILSAVAMAGIAFAFTGFKHGVELAGEARQPKTAIPLAIIGSVIICLLLYLALQITFIGAIKPSLLVHGWQHLSFTNDSGPFAGILLALGLMWLLKLLYIDAAVSPLGAGLIYMTSTARIVYAMARSGYLPQVIAKVNRQHLPIGAIILNFILGLAFFIPFSGWQAMVSFLVSVMVIAYAMGPIALLAMRKQLPSIQRKFTLPIPKFFCSLGFYCCLLISYWTGWQTISRLAIVALIGVIVFLIAYYRRRITNAYLGLRFMVWCLLFIGGLTLISFLGNFGGIKLIPFGWDFAVIGLFSLILLFLGYHCRLSRQQALQVQEDLGLANMNH